MNKKIKLGLVTRSHEVRQDDVNPENRTIELSFSSDDPYKRDFGVEILSHKTDHVDMGFMASGNAPLLAGHNHDDQIGVVEKAWLQDGVGRARVRFGRSDRATEFFNDVEDGIRKNISVGYYIQEMKLHEESKDGPDTYLVTRWKPVEASIVAVPADETVGIRSADDQIDTVIITKNSITQNKEAEKMPEEIKTEEKKIDMNQIRETEKKRQAEIMAIGETADMKDAAKKAVDSGESVADFRAKAFDKMTQKMAQPAVDMDSLSDQDNDDLAGYSFTKALREAGAGKLTGVEKEMHQEGIKQLKDSGVSAQGTLSVPYQVLAQRDLTVGTDSQGGYTVANNLLAGSFIDLLRNAMKVREMGATVLDNLVGDIAIPTQATGASAAWEGENDSGSEQSQTFGQLALAPNRVGCYSEVSKKLLVQSSLAVDNIVKNDLATAIALAIDLAALHGTGANDQPTGIAATSGIGSVAGGTNGLAPTYAHMISLETEVAQDNADVGRMGYLTNAKVRGKLKNVFSNATYGEIPVWNNGMMNGYKAIVSNQVSSALTKGTSSGVCSAIFFGNWADLIVALWGGLDIVVDPYTLATTNLTRITVNTYADVGVRHAQSFAAMLDALTT